MNLDPIIIAFTFTFLAELGDKTQLMIISLSSFHKKLTLFFVALTALLTVNLMGVLTGAALKILIPEQVTRLLIGILFILFGLFFLRYGKKDASLFKTKYTILTVFLLVSAAELGDKTQLSLVALSAKYEPITVFLGAFLSFSLITWVNVTLGSKLCEIISVDKLKLLCSLLFIVFGVLCLLGF